jgi:hypothetical protein
LCLERIPFRIAVEVFQEGIFFELFQDHACPDCLGKPCCECGLSCTDHALDGDIVQIAVFHQMFYRFQICHVEFPACANPRGGGMMF